MVFQGWTIFLQVRTGRWNEAFATLARARKSPCYTHSSGQKMSNHPECVSTCHDHADYQLIPIYVAISMVVFGKCICHDQVIPKSLLFDDRVPGLSTSQQLQSTVTQTKIIIQSTSRRRWKSLATLGLKPRNVEKIKSPHWDAKHLPLLWSVPTSKALVGHEVAINHSEEAGNLCTVITNLSMNWDIWFSQLLHVDLQIGLYPAPE